MKKKIAYAVALAVMLAGTGVVPAGHMAPNLAYAAEHESSGGGEGEGGKEGEKPPEFEYYQMKPMILPVITDRGLTQQVSLVVSLELPYGKKKDVEQIEPRLADAYLQDLYGALGNGNAMMRGSVVDIKAVKDRLTSVTHKIAGPDMVHDVLLQVMQQRRMM